MEQAQGNTGSFNAVEYGPGQAARDAEHDALKTDELTEPRALNTDPLTAAVTPDNAVMPDPHTVASVMVLNALNQVSMYLKNMDGQNRLFLP